MKIIAAPNAFKGSLTSSQAAECIAVGARQVFPDAEIIQLPVADGGDGTIEVIITNTDGTYEDIPVLNPFGEPTTARLGLLPDGNTAVVEMAEASGIRLVARQRLNPMQTTTYGTGQLIAAALDRDVDRIIVGVGGSATVDGGVGMAQALGVCLLDENGDDIPYGGHGLAKLHHIDISDLDPRIHDTEIVVASDVDNPLTGENGAARIFGPQKGATQEMVETLEVELTRFAEIIRRDLNIDLMAEPSMGAAGGLAAGLCAFLGAKIEMGAEVVLDLISFDDHLADCDLVMTGEGQIDNQTIYGKGPIAVAKHATKHGIPVIAIAGGISDDADVVYDHGIDALISLMSRPMSLGEALDNAHDLMIAASARALRMVRVGKSLHQPR